VERLEGNAIIAQGGGPTAVINQSLVGAILESHKQNAINKLFGAVHGVERIVNEDFINLNKLDEKQLATLARTPSSALLSTRDKPDKQYCKK
jgi:6-phosphofructokinase 1